MLRHIKRTCYLLAIDLAAVMSIGLFYIHAHEPSDQEDADQVAVGIPFDKKVEHYVVSVGRPWWFVTLILPKEYYSKDNLETIFRYYMGKYPDKGTALTVEVFADSESYERYRNNPTKGAIIFSNEPPKPLTKDNWDREHASFLRACDNQFYYYSTDLENPVKQERVLLKGRWTAGPELGDCKKKEGQER
jgi:hypothetical protein